VCPYYRRGDENLCVAPRFTGYDVDGGYAEFMTAPEDFIYTIGIITSGEAEFPLPGHVTSWLCPVSNEDLFEAR
jgi:propanol-preferring alcohol dehydrogenase